MTTLTYGSLRKFISAGYDKKQPAEIDGYVYDKDLSHSTANVYYNAEKNEALINHRGTSGIFDWLNNAMYMYGGESYYKMTPRYWEAEKAQKATEKKYNQSNVITTGHSAGGLLAELLGKNSKQIITLNKASRPQFFPPKKHSNQTDIRSKCDIISAGGYYDKQIECDSYDILKEHKSDILERIENKMIGEGEGKNNISRNNIEMNYTHLHPNAFRNIRHHLLMNKDKDDSKFKIPEYDLIDRKHPKITFQGKGLNSAEPMIKYPHHPVIIPEKGMKGRGSGRGLTAESHSGRGLTAEGHSGSGMCGSGMCLCKEEGTGCGCSKRMKGMGCGCSKGMKGKGMKGSQAMKDKMAKLRAMRNK